MAKQTLDLDKALTVARKAAEAGREVLLDYFRQLTRVREKHQAGLVSEADEESEAVIRRILNEFNSGIHFLGEEDSALRPNQRPADWCEQGNWWVVDPLDGTTNYVHGMPIFCISIGLVWEGRVVVGVVDMPKLNTTYWGKRGGGAFVDDRPMRVSNRNRLEESLLATGFFRENKPALRQQLNIFSQLVYQARGIRRAGAAAYDMCLVAEGVYEAFWEKNLNPWDVAAGLLLVEEAGGKVTDYCGVDFDLNRDSVLASNGHLHQVLVDTIQACP